MPVCIKANFFLAQEIELLQVNALGGLCPQLKVIYGYISIHHYEEDTMKRRDFINLSGAAAGLALIPVCNLSAAEVPLTADDPQGKALGYVVNSTVEGSNCANCAQSHGDAKALACNLFPGKQVSATGWCKVWSKKA